MFQQIRRRVTRPNTQDTQRTQVRDFWELELADDSSSSFEFPPADYRQEGTSSDSETETTTASSSSSAPGQDENKDAALMSYLEEIFAEDIDLLRLRADPHNFRDDSSCASSMTRLGIAPRKNSLRMSDKVVKTTAARRPRHRRTQSCDDAILLPRIYAAAVGACV